MEITATSTENQVKQRSVSSVLPAKCLTKSPFRSARGEQIQSDADNVDMEIQAIEVVEEVKEKGADKPPMLLVDVVNKDADLEGKPVGAKSDVIILVHLKENIVKDQKLGADYEDEDADIVENLNFNSQVDGTSIVHLNVLKLERQIKVDPSTHVLTINPSNLKTQMPKLVADGLIRKCSSNTSRIRNELGTKVHRVEREQNRRRTLWNYFLDDEILTLTFDPGGKRVVSSMTGIGLKTKILDRADELFEIIDRVEFNDARHMGFGFPFSVFYAFSDSGKNCKSTAKITEESDNDRKDLLRVGAYAFDSLKSFLGVAQGRSERSWIPRKLSASTFVEDDAWMFPTGKSMVKLRFQEIKNMARNCVAPGFKWVFSASQMFVVRDKRVRWRN